MSSHYRLQSREQVRESTLDAVERLSSVAPLSTINLKRLADEADVSTMVVYSHFGDRFGLEQALLHRSHESLMERIAALGPTSFGAVAVEMRVWAAEYPARFAALFIGGTLDPDLTDEVGSLVQQLVELVSTITSSAPTTGEAGVLLAAVVGVVSFAAAGRLPGLTDDQLRRVLGGRQEAL